MKRLLPLLAALLIDRLAFAFWPHWTLFRPELVVLAVVYSALAWEPLPALLSAWVAGLVMDFSGWGPLGAYSGGLLLVTLIVLLLRDALYRRSPGVRAGATLGGCLLVAGAGWALTELTASVPPPGGWEMLSGAGLTTLLALPLFALWDRLLDSGDEG